MKRNFHSLCLIALIILPIPNLHGGEFPTISEPLWRLHQYKYTELLRTEPLSWCPFKSYLMVDKYVEVKDYHDINWLIINADLIGLVQDDAEYNRTHARRYKGKAKTRLRKIYNYCHRTEYVAHVKFARNVFEQRQGDCAGISSAFYVLCKKNRIPCRYIIGWTDTGCHAWNKVKIGKRWYWCDATLGIWMKRKLPKGWSIMEMW